MVWGSAAPGSGADALWLCASQSFKSPRLKCLVYEMGVMIKLGLQESDTR